MDQATGLRNIVKKESGKIMKPNKAQAGISSAAENRPRVIAVTSGKGGVGKTNVVGNLAVVLQQMGKKALILDADLGLANIDILFGLNTEHNIDQVIRGEKQLSEIIIKGPEGVSVIPSSSGIHEMTHLTQGHQMNLLSEFDNLNKIYDVLLIDTGAGISSNVLYFTLAAQERILVVTPEPTSITDAYALLKVMFSKHGTNHFFVLLNMTRDQAQAKSVFKHLSQIVDRFFPDIFLEYAGYIPSDDFLQKSVGRRKPVVCAYPRALSSNGFRTLADFLLHQTIRRPLDGNIKFFWKKLVDSKTAG